jgi:hypothetical protein
MDRTSLGQNCSCGARNDPAESNALIKRSCYKTRNRVMNTNTEIDCCGYCKQFSIHKTNHVLDSASILFEEEHVPAESCSYQQ